jgi:hypothetical protein
LAPTLQSDFRERIDLGLGARENLAWISVCTVFAEKDEGVFLIANGKEVMEFLDRLPSLFIRV